MWGVPELTQSSLVAPPILQRGYQQRAHADNAAVEEVSHQPLPFRISFRFPRLQAWRTHEPCRGMRHWEPPTVTPLPSLLLLPEPFCILSINDHS